MKAASRPSLGFGLEELRGPRGLVKASRRADLPPPQIVQWWAARGLRGSAFDFEVSLRPLQSPKILLRSDVWEALLVSFPGCWGRPVPEDPRQWSPWRHAWLTVGALCTCVDRAQVTLAPKASNLGFLGSVHAAFDLVAPTCLMCLG